jgi:hypothetical protein
MFARVSTGRAINRNMNIWNGMKELFDELMPLIIAVISGVFTVWVTKIQHEKKEKSKEIDKLRKEKDDLSMGIEFDLQTFNNIQIAITSVFTDTAFDNFVIMTAMNGQRDFRFISALYEQHSERARISMGATGRYVKFEFDTHYREVLKRMESAGELDFNIQEMQESDLKNMFLADGVADAKMVFVARAKMDDENDRVFFFVLSSHSVVNAQDKLKARAYIGSIKEIIKSALETNE